MMNPLLVLAGQGAVLMGILLAFQWLNPRPAWARALALGGALGIAVWITPAVPDIRALVAALAGGVGGPWAAVGALLVEGPGFLGTGVFPAAMAVLTAGAASLARRWTLGRRSWLPWSALGLAAALPAALQAGQDWVAAACAVVGMPALLTAFGALAAETERRAATEAALSAQNRMKDDQLTRRTRERDQTNETLGSLLEALPDAVFVYDQAGSIVEVNQAMINLYGLSGRNEALGSSPLDYAAPGPESALDPSTQPAAGRSVVFDWSCQSKKGALFSTVVTLTQIPFRGAPHWLATVKPGSPPPAAPEAPAVSDETAKMNQRLRIATRVAQMGIWDWDLLTDKAEWDDTMDELYETSGSMPRGYPVWNAHLHPEDRDAANQAVQDALAGKRVFDTEFRILNARGERHIRAYGEVIREGDRPIRMVGVNYDITDRKLAEEALMAEKQRLQQHLDVVEAIVAGFDREGRLTILNRKGHQVLGYEPGELQGTDWFRVCVPPDQYAAATAAFRQVLAGGSTSFEYYEGELVTRTGERRFVAWHNTAVRDPSGAVLGTLSSGEDITERRRAQEQLDLYSGHLEELVTQRTKELAAARDAADAANHAKSLFLANMSHEIRTPMNAVLGFAQLLAKESGLSDAGIHKVGTIIKNGEHLLAIINDILEMSRIEAGRLELKPQPFDLEELLGDLSAHYSLRASEKGLFWTFERTADLPRIVVADAVRVRQVMNNLLGNAIKYTESGSIGLFASRSGADVALEVRDTGVGIPLEERARLFQPFERARTGQAVAGGTGLGLAISRRYAMLMGGDITLEDQGDSTCFRFVFNAQEAHAAPGPRDPLPNLPALHDDHQGTLVLVVDDLRSNRELLRGMLEPQGYVVLEASDGREALRLVAESHPRIVLMDLLMPGLDGYQATRGIREAQSGPVTIIGISASAFETERSHFESSGLDGFLAKPFRFQELHDLISQLSEVGFSEVEQRSAAPAKPSDTPLPEEWSKAFVSAIAQGNVTKLRQLGEAAYDFDPGLSAWIGERAARYELDELRGFLKSRGLL